MDMVVRTARFFGVLLLCCGALAFAEEPRALTLDEAVDLARGASVAVRMAELDVQKSDATLREARSRRGPTIQLQSTASMLSNPPEGVSITKGSLGYAPTVQSEIPVALPDQNLVLAPDAEHTYFTLRTTLTQPLFTAGKLDAAEQLARLQSRIERVELDQAVLDTDSEIRNLYLGGRLAEQALPVLDEMVETARLILDDRKRSYEEGLITYLSVLDAKSQLAGVEFQREISRQGLATACEAIAYVTQTHRPFTFVTPFRTWLPEVNEQALREKLARSALAPALLELRAQQARVAADLSQAGRPFRPDLSLSVTLDISGQRVPIVGANWTDSWNANLIVSIGTQVEIFDSGRARFAFEGSAIDVEKATAGIDAFTRSVPLQVRRSVEAVHNAYFELQYAAAALNFADEQLANARVSYENDLLTREELSLARLGALLSSLELLSRSWAYDSALTSLESLVGRRFDSGSVAGGAAENCMAAPSRGY